MSAKPKQKPKLNHPQLSLVVDNTPTSTVEPQQAVNDVDRLNAAVLLGTSTDAMQALLLSEVTFLTGALWGTRDQRNTQDGGWEPKSMPWLAWIGGGAGTGKGTPDWGFSRHPVSKAKEGQCIVLGSSIGKARKAKAMEYMYAMGLDIDSGASLDSVTARLEELGLFCIIYTSFNHSKSGLQLKRDDVLRKLKITSDPTLIQIQQYLREFDKSRYEEDFIARCTIKSAKKQVKDGVVIELDTPPLDKFRLILPLAEKIKLVDLAETHEAALEVWEDKITGLAVEMLGVHFDVSCTDASRLFYTGRHPENAEDWYCAVVQGNPLKFGEVPTYKKSRYTAKRDNINPFEQAGEDLTVGKAPMTLTPSGRSLNDWHTKFKSRFLIANLLEDYCGDRLIHDGTPPQGSVFLHCPFESEHTSEGGTGTMATNCIDNAQFGYWTVHCKHDACQGRHKTQFLEEMLRQGWFEEEVIYDLEGGYLLEAEDGEEEATGNPTDARFEPVAQWLPKHYVHQYGGIWLRDGEDEDEEDGKPRGNMILCQSFNVIGRASNQAGDALAGVIIHFKNENEVDVEVTILRAELVLDNGGGVLQVLAGAGMRLFVGNKKSREKLLNLFRQITPKRHIPTVSQPGWVQDRGGVVVGFLCPTGEYIAADDGLPYRLASSATVKDKAPAGTLQGWKDAAQAALSQVENYYWGIGAAGGFVGPLLELAGEPSCGCNLSGESSKGKTIALLLGGSAWATPRESRGVVSSMNSTTNAVEDLATIGSGNFLGLDEVSTMARPQDLPAVLFGLSSGAGKSRKSGRGAGLAEGAEFKTFGMLSNEHPLRVVVTKAGGDYKTGLSVRFPDIDVTAGVTVSAEVLAEIDAIKRNYGHAGPAFVRWLIAQRWHLRGGELRKQIDKVSREMAGDVNPAQIRAARVFALVQVAGELACEAGLLYDSAKVRAAVAMAWKTFKGSDEGKATQGEESMLDGFRSWLAQGMGLHLADSVEEYDAKTHRERKGWFTDDQFILIADAIDVRAMGLSGTREGLLKALDGIGALVKSGKNSPHNKLPASCGGGQVRNYRIDRLKLGLPKVPAPEDKPEAEPVPAPEAGQAMAA